MMSFIREEYASASDWLSALKKGEEWTLYLKKLQHAAPGDMSRLRSDAMRRIGKGKTFEYWDIFSHNVELTVEKVWRIAELTLPKLEIQTVGMLSIEWLDQHSSGNQVSNIREPSPDVVNQLKPIFYGSEEEAKAFLVSIQGMKPTQITDKVNQLVSEKKISDMSKHRDLWKVLHDCGIYEIRVKLEHAGEVVTRHNHSKKGNRHVSVPHFCAHTCTNTCAGLVFICICLYYS